MNKEVRKGLKVLEVYLFEYCEVNGISEKDLGKYVYIEHFQDDNSIAVINADDDRDIKFGVKYLPDFEFFGEYIYKKESYPKTTDFIGKI